MRYTRNAITQLKRQYKSVLLKCALINAALFMAVAPAVADVAVGDTDTSNHNIYNTFNNNGTMTGSISVSFDQASASDPIIYGTFNNNATGVVSGDITDKGIVNNSGKITGNVVVDIEEATNGMAIGTFNNLSGAEINNTYIDNYGGIFANSGSIITNNLYNEGGGLFTNSGNFTISGDGEIYNEGTFTNSGSIVAYYIEQEINEEYAEDHEDYTGPQFTNSGNITAYELNNYAGSFDNSGILAVNYLNNYYSTLNNDNGEIYAIYINTGDAELNNQGTIITSRTYNDEGNINNSGTFNNMTFRNAGLAYNTGNLNAILEFENYEQFFNQNNVTTTYLRNRGIFKNDGNLEIVTPTAEGIKETMGEDNIIMAYKYNKEISDEEWNAYSAEHQQELIDAYIAETLDDYGIPTRMMAVKNYDLIRNTGSLLNGVTGTMVTDGEAVTMEEAATQDTDVIEAISILDEPVEYTHPEQVEYHFGAGEGTITGDVVNYGDYRGTRDIAPISVPVYYAGSSMMPFGYSALAWNNGTINGDVFNAGTFVNGVTFDSVSNYEEVEDSYEDEEGEHTYTDWNMVGYTAEAGAVSDAVINASFIHNNWGGTLINGGEINADTIYNGFRLENGVVMGQYTSSYGGLRYTSEYSMPEPTLLPTATITADEIYNDGFIVNGGVINGDIYNIGYASYDGDDEEIYTGSEPSAIAMYNGTINGNVVGEVWDEATEMAVWKEKFSKFEEMQYILSRGLTLDDSEEEPEYETLDTTGMLYGSLQTFVGDNVVTGALSAEEVIVRPNTSLTVGNGESGGDLTAKWLKVGVVEDSSSGEIERGISLIEADDISSDIPVTNCKPATRCMVVMAPEPSRLDIGTNTANADYAHFGEDSTLALTVENEEIHGKVIAGKFNIENGATLEVTVMPGFSEKDKEFELKLLEEVGGVPDEIINSWELVEEGEVSSGEGDGSVNNDVSDGEEGGFNNFNDKFISKADGDSEGEEMEQNEETGVFQNNIFEIKRVDDEGTYSFKQIKTAEEVIVDPEPKPEPEVIIDPDPEPTPAPTPIIDPVPSPAPSDNTLELGQMAKAWLDDGRMHTPGSVNMQDALSRILQHSKNVKHDLKEVLSALAPNNSPVTQSVSGAVMGHIFSGVGAHLSKPKSGLSSGDALNGVSAWGSTYYGNAKLDDRADGVYGFDADSKGITAGVDKQITPDIKLGFGLQYDKSDINAFKRDVDVDTTAVFGYGEYRPSNWYVSGVAAYGRSDYDEKKFSAQTVTAHYKADLFGLQALTGYDMATRYAELSPNIGLRYNYIKRHSYNDGANQDISGSNSDILSGVAGLKVAKSFGGLRPSAYVNLTYDMISDRDSSTVTLTNGSSYTVDGKRLNRFGVEAGAALEYNCGNWDIIANYDYSGRKHFNSHLGMLTVKYHF